MNRTLALIICVLLVGCADLAPQNLSPAAPKLILILVGGNSESISHGGIKDLYKGAAAQKAESTVIKDLAAVLKISPDDVSVHYFSWTGDAEDQKGILPGHWNWITGGSALIQDQLPQIRNDPSNRPKISIVGWSNGGATAYELSCDLTKRFSNNVSLLITLDPVAWTTTPCVAVDGTPLRVASNWIDAYTHSSMLNRFQFGNIIALFGRAWNDNFPPLKADDIQLVPDTNHGATLTMWKSKVITSPALKKWAESE